MNTEEELNKVKKDFREFVEIVDEFVTENTQYGGFLNEDMLSSHEGKAVSDFIDILNLVLLENQE